MNPSPPLSVGQVEKGLMETGCFKAEEFFNVHPKYSKEISIEMVELDCIQATEVHGTWKLFTLARFASYSHICISVCLFIFPQRRMHGLSSYSSVSSTSCTNSRRFIQTISSASSSDTAAHVPEDHPPGRCSHNQLPAFRIRLGSSVPLCKHHSAQGTGSEGS